MCDKRCRSHGKSEPVLKLTPHLKHHGKWLCSKCDKFITWAKNPKTQADLDYRRNLIVEKLKKSRSH